MNYPKIIAEAGVNHNGSMEQANKIIKAAAKAGAWAVKWQTYTGPDISLPSAPKFWHWKGDADHKDQLETYTSLGTFGKTDYAQLKKMCDYNAVEFMSTPFSLDAVEMLASLGMQYWKIASCDIATPPLLEAINAVKNKRMVLLSTGASHIKEIKEALSYLMDSEVCLMHCNLQYPTPTRDANLGAIIHMADEFKHIENLHMGYSDHTLGVDVAAASVMYGAEYIEKHFTTDKSLDKSADHWLSADPPELEELCRRAGLLWGARGWKSGNLHEGNILDKCVKRLNDGELVARKYARRCIVTTQPIKNGEEFRGKVTMKRPWSFGLGGEHWDTVVEGRATIDLRANAPIMKGMVE
jgi:N,N'-diacetyllegionaminate synthase